MRIIPRHKWYSHKEKCYIYGIDWKSVFTRSFGSLIVAVVIGLIILALASCWWASHDNNMAMSTYWENFVEPYIVEDNGNHVVITCPEAGLWQAGDMTLSKYNESLRDRHRWNDHPLWGPLNEEPPDHLKYVSINGI